MQIIFLVLVIFFYLSIFIDFGKIIISLFNDNLKILTYSHIVEGLKSKTQ